MYSLRTVYFCLNRYEVNPDIYICICVCFNVYDMYIFMYECMHVYVCKHGNNLLSFCLLNRYEVNPDYVQQLEAAGRLRMDM